MKYKYLLQYKFSNIFNMLRNVDREPEICSNKFDNKLVIITGSTAGIGFVTAKRYAEGGAKLLLINRNEEKSKKQCEDLRSLYGCDCDYFISDFSRLDDIHRVGEYLANLEENIDVLIHNSGVFNNKIEFTVDDLEMVFQVNYLSTFIINEYVKEKIKKQNFGRIIYVNSEGHRFAVLGVYIKDLKWKKHFYTGLKAYGSAKTAQLLSMLHFDDYFKNTEVTVNAMHPGNVRSDMGNNNGKFYKWKKKLMVDKTAKDPIISAESLYYLGVSNKVKTISGKFFHLTTLEIPAPPALDRNMVPEIVKISKILGRLT